MLLPATLATAQAPPVPGAIAFASTRSPEMWAPELLLADSRGRISNLTQSPSTSDKDAAISPDGKEVVFSRREGGAEDLHALTLSGRSLRRLTWTPQLYESSPAYSPSGDEIAFVRGTLHADDALWIVDRLGRERRLTPDDDYKTSVVWSPSGTRLAFHDRAGLHVINRDGSGHRHVATALSTLEKPPIAWIGSELLVPEERPQAAFGLRAIDPDNGTSRRIRNPCGKTLLTFSPDRTHVACDQDAEERRIPIRTRQGKLLRWVTLFPKNQHTMIDRFSLGPSGRQLVYDATTDERQGDVWLLRSGRFRQLTSSREEDHTPALSPDRRTVAFVRSRYQDRRGPGKLMLVSARGGPARALPSPGVGDDPSWAPDGKRIAYEARGWICIASITSRRARRLVRGSDPTWSPDGRSLAFVRPLRRGDSIHTIRVTGNKMRRLAVIRNGAGDLAWSPDARSIAFSTASTAIAVLTVSNRTVRELVKERDNNLSSPTWSPDGRLLAYATGWDNDIPYPWHAPEAHFLEIWTVGVADGARRPLIRDAGFNFAPDWR